MLTAHLSKSTFLLHKMFQQLDIAQLIPFFMLNLEIQSISLEKLIGVLRRRSPFENKSTDSNYTFDGLLSGMHGSARGYPGTQI